jgi:hypothetical protein
MPTYAAFGDTGEVNWSAGILLAFDSAIGPCAAARLATQKWARIWVSSSYSWSSWPSFICWWWIPASSSAQMLISETITDRERRQDKGRRWHPQLVDWMP